MIMALLIACLSAMPASGSEFHVSDYGAKGDGIANDRPAIRAAVEAAVEAGPGSKVVFDKKRYRLAKANLNYQIALKDVKGLTLEGNGAELINNPWNNIISLEGCEDVTVRGFVIDFDPLPFTQGRITDVDADAGTFLLRIQDGYDNPVAVYRKLGKTKPNWGWGVCMDPVERKRKPEAVMHFYIANVEEAEDRLLRVTLDERSRKDTDDLEAGDRFVMSIMYGGGGANFLIRQSKNCRLENNTIYTAKYGMVHGLSDNRGRIHVKDVKITFKPGSDRLITTHKDGFHCKHNAVGPIIEDGRYEGMLDDSINISVCPYWVREDLGENRYLIAEHIFLPREGDTLMAYRPNPGTMTHGLIVESVEPRDTPRGMRGRWAVITLNKPIPNLGLHQGRDLFPGGRDKLIFTGLYNLDASGKDYIIRGNTFKAQRRHAILARASGGLIENNVIDGVGGNGVTLNNEIGSFYEGPLPRDVIIRNNTFSHTFFDSIHVYTNGHGAVAENITITGNRITDWHTNPRNPKSAAAICLRNVNGAVIQNNIIGPSAAPADIAKPIRLVNCEHVTLEHNEFEGSDVIE